MCPMKIPKVTSSVDLYQKLRKNDKNMDFAKNKAFIYKLAL